MRCGDIQNASIIHVEDMIFKNVYNYTAYIFIISIFNIYK